MTPAEEDGLLGLLDQALRQVDPVPEHVMRMARGAYAWRTIDADLAAIAYDSGLEEMVGARGDEVARQLTFAAPGLEIEVMIVPDGGRRLLGQLVPPREVTVSLSSGGDSLQTMSDSLGRFRFETIRPGPTRLTVIGDDWSVATEWVVL